MPRSLKSLESSTSSLYEGVTAELKDWYKQETQGYTIYWGKIHEDKKRRWRSGTRIHTSYQVKIYEYEHHYLLHTRNSVYRLWKKDERKADANSAQEEKGVSSG